MRQNLDRKGDDMSKQDKAPVRLDPLPAWIMALAKANKGDYPRLRMIDGRRMPNLIDGRPVLTGEEYRQWRAIVEGDDVGILDIAGLPFALRLAVMYFWYGSEEGHYLPYRLG